jgi:hypothetical protein
VAKKGRKRPNHPRKPNRPTIVRRPREERTSYDAESQPMMRTLSHALHASHPLALLDTVSGLMLATMPRPQWGLEEDPAVTLDQLVESFVGTDLAGTTAALHVIAAMSADEVMRARIRRTLATRQHRMPPWIQSLDRTRVERVVEMRHVQRDGEDYWLDVRLPDGFSATAMVYVDNNMGGVVKDGFLTERPIDQVFDVIRQETDEDTALQDVDAADARAVVEQAIHFGSIMVPPLETETWPLCRPLVEWLVRMLPEGGSVPEPPDWDDEKLDAIADLFLASRFGQGFDEATYGELLNHLLWLGAEYDVGDPLRWTPVNIEMVLVDRAPRKVVLPTRTLALLPDLMRAFVRYAHHEKGWKPHLTAEALQAVDRWEPEYQQLIRTDRPRGAEALARWSMEAAGVDLPAYVSPGVAAVGSREALDELDDAPLPDEAFDWEGIDDDIRAKVAEILALCDDNADTLLDVEHRTANRRLLRAVALADPAFFRGRAAAHTSAAAICWLVAQANDSVGQFAPVTVSELLKPFGVTSAGQRGQQFRKMLGLHEKFGNTGPIVLGSPDYLVGVMRSELVRRRDQGW